MSESIDTGGFLREGKGMGRELGVSLDMAESGIAAVRDVVSVVRNVVIVKAGQVDGIRRSPGPDVQHAEAGRPGEWRATEVGLVSGIVTDDAARRASVDAAVGVMLE
jgi:hypothetical protein